MQIRTSAKLKGYKGENPFHESQARSYADSKVVDQFFPVSLYWSLFNDQHEILLGTRGSGKTILLKMMSYSFLRAFKANAKASELARTKKYIGFYLPLHFEFVTSLSGGKIPDSEKLEYFQFALNCAAIKSFLEQVRQLLLDCFEDTSSRLLAESNIIHHLSEMWFGGDSSGIVCISDIQWKIEIAYQNQSFWRDGEEHYVQVPFDKEVFVPLLSVLRKISEDLNLDPNNTSWIACLDEADFLKESFWIPLNGFMRSEKRPLVLKIATLPFNYSTRSTVLPGVSVEPDGNDFNFRIVDLKADSSEFVALTNYLLAKRLTMCNLGMDNTNLEEFLGVVNNDDLVDYFRLEMSKDKSIAITTETEILEQIVGALSEKRQRHYQEIKGDKSKITASYLKRFSPVYYVRKMKELNSHGNRTVGWFAGANTIRRVSDGNPRRFIQLIYDCVELARVHDLTPMYQHRVVKRFADRKSTAAEGLPEYGPLLQEILGSMGDLLAERVHGYPMLDGGSCLTIDEELLQQEFFTRALQLGIQYSYIFCENPNVLFERIRPGTLLRLAYVCAVHFWLPMRKGDKVVLKKKTKNDLFTTSDSILQKGFRKGAINIVQQLQLELEFENDK